MNRQFTELKTVSGQGLKEWLKIVTFRQWNPMENYNKSVLYQNGQISKYGMENPSWSIIKYFCIKDKQ